MQLGRLHLKSNLLLAPLEGVSDVGFRRLCFHNGAGLTWTEMIRASGVVRKNRATLDLIDTFDAETLTGIQLFAVNERELQAALGTLESCSATMPHLLNIRAVDLNFGCPSPDVIRVGAGPALLKRSNKLHMMFKTLRDWQSRTSMNIDAIGAKIRLGLNQAEQEHKVYLRIITAANDHLDYLTVHARHAKQKSHDLPSWNAISEIKERATIPIIGNGNVFDAASARQMLLQTKCDGIMLARGAIKNPWVFREIPGGPAASTSEIDDAMQEYFSFAAKFHTKQKYTNFHKENFLRMKERKEMRFPGGANFT